MLSKKSTLLISLLVVGSTIFTGCANTNSNTNTTAKASVEKAKTTFADWEKKEIVWPEWAAPTEVEIDEDVKYATFQLRASLTIEDAQDNIKQLRYLIENKEQSEETPSYHYWMYNLGDSLLKVGEYQLAYHYLTKVAELPSDTIVRESKKDGNIVKSTKEELKLDRSINIMMLKILAIQGFDEEFKAKKENLEFNSPVDASTIAFAYGTLGNKEEAYKTFEFATSPENFKDKNSLRASSSSISAAAYAYTNGDYDKVLQLTDRINKEGTDSKNPVYFAGYEEDKSEFPMRQWKSSFAQVEAYRHLAEKAKNGQVADFKNLKDGEYESSIISYMQTPVDVKVTVKDGKVSDVIATQQSHQDDRSNGAFDIVAKRIVEKQSTDVDTISGATLSSEAVRIGTLEALLKAK